MPFASVNGQQLYFEDTAGNGPVVVFSHGNLMNRDMWVAQVEALRGEFRCVVWDGRLHGRTKDDGGLYTYWDAADDLLGLLDHLGVEQETLVGPLPRGLPVASCGPARARTGQGPGPDRHCGSGLAAGDPGPDERHPGPLP
jgi:hypothetical protein